MGFRNFRLNVAARVLLIGAVVFAAAFSAAYTEWQITPVAAAVFALLLLLELIRYVEAVNRELAECLTFIAHSDFSANVSVQSKGSVFRELEEAYKLLTERFRKLNLQRAADHEYLHSLVEHVSVAVICIDASGTVKLMNRQAKSLLRTPHLAALKSFARIDPKLPALIEKLGDGGQELIGVTLGDDSMQLSLHVTEFQLLGGRHRIISLQDINDQLEQRELDYAQKLIKVLRHEIMNSMTPIISLTKLIEDRLVDPVNGHVSVKELTQEAQRDLRRSLASIQSRGDGLLRFVKAYGELTNLPRPNFDLVEVGVLFDQTQALLAPVLEARGIELGVETVVGKLAVRVDPQQIEQVLINLVKNAAEALEGRDDGKVLLRAARDGQGKVAIQVIDNGPGIEAAQLEKVFLPFFTTKRHGTGVGLSVSKQIMLLNKGLLMLKSTPGVGSQFVLRFPPAEERSTAPRDAARVA